MGKSYYLIRNQGRVALASRIFEGILAITLGTLLGCILGFFPPRAWVMVGAGGVLLLFPLQPGKFILGYLIISPLLDQLVYLLPQSGLLVGPQILVRGGMIMLLVFYWLAAQRNPLLVKAARPMFILLLWLVLSTFSSGMIEKLGLTNLAKIAFWMLLLPTVADLVAHEEVKLYTIYRCMLLSTLITIVSLLSTSYFRVSEFSRYGVGEMSGLFTPHSLALNLSLGLIVILALATQQQNQWLRLVLLLFGAGVVVSIAKTYVRTGWLACIVMLFTLNLMFWRYGKDYSGRKALMWGQVIIAGVIAIYTLTHLELLIERNRDFAGGEGEFGSGRVFIYTTHLRNYANFSILKKVIGGGMAATSFYTQYRSYATHSDYVNVLLAGGFVGTSLHLWLFISLWKQIKSTAQNNNFPLIIAGCAIATYLVAAMTNGVWDYASVMTSFSFLVGGAIGYYQLSSPQGESL